jgi:hypothetical protein
MLVTTYRAAMMISVLTVLRLLVPGSASTANAAPPALCDLQLQVELTPDVPDPRDLGFLSSLLGNHPGYRLTLLQEADGSVIVLDLTGPGPGYVCRNVVEAMRRDARVLSVHVQRETS